jgi:transposase
VLVIDSQSVKTTRVGGEARGYRDELVDKVKQQLGWDMEITLRSDKEADFKPLPKRWSIERTFSRLENFRRLAKDYDYTVSSSTAMVFIAFILLAFNKIS